MYNMEQIVDVERYLEKKALSDEDLGESPIAALDSSSPRSWTRDEIDLALEQDSQAAGRLTQRSSSGPVEEGEPDHEQRRGGDVPAESSRKYLAQSIAALLGGRPLALLNFSPDELEKPLRLGVTLSINDYQPAPCRAAFATH